MRDGCTCPIEVVDVDHDGTPVRGCIDHACDCDVCGHEPRIAWCQSVHGHTGTVCDKPAGPHRHGGIDEHGIWRSW